MEIMKSLNEDDWQMSRHVSLSVYVPPKLREFGPVGALTQAGVGSMAERGAEMCSGGNTMKQSSCLP